MLSSRLTLLPPPPSLSVPPIRLPLVFSRRGVELVSNFHDYFCFPFLALCVSRFPLVAAAAATALFSLLRGPSAIVPPRTLSSPLTLRDAVKFPAARAICSRTYLYFIIAEVFTLCLASSLSVPPSRRLVSSPLLLARSPARASLSPLICSHVYYTIFIASTSAYYTTMLRGTEGTRTERQAVRFRYTAFVLVRTILSGPREVRGRGVYFFAPYAKDDDSGEPEEGRR